MAESRRPSAEEIILYEKDPKTKIATITINRPDNLNSPTIAARLRYSKLIHRANVDDDVKVLVIRGVGSNLGGGADLPEQSEMLSPNADVSLLKEFEIGDYVKAIRAVGARRSACGEVDWRGRRAGS